MAITSLKLNELENNIRQLFYDIGQKNGTQMPRSKESNTDAIVYEYWVARMLSRIAAAREKEAKQRLIDNDIIQDYESIPYDPNMDRPVYVSELMCLHIKTTANVMRFIRKKLAGACLRNGVDAPTARKIEQECLEEGGPVTTTTPSILTNDR